MNSENEAIGFMEVIVKTANGAIPIENARVSIYEHLPAEGSEQSGDKGNILYSLLTDTSGRTPRVALSAKDKSLSTEYGNKNPYKTYSIAVEKDGYYTNRYTGVPVFQGITSLQPVDLVPLLEYASPKDDYPSLEKRYIETPSTDL